ncbi:DEAD/DEAH box helicase [Salmonella enterica subsp. enterica]|nr:DEAD/DEAH box helicase [Salmonella enterica subsp. enterica serovar Westhampton]
MNFSDLFIRAGLNIRDIQQEYTLAAYAGLSVKGRVALLSADTGVGKTLGYLTAALRIIEHNPKAQFVIATSSHALMTQIMGQDRQIISRIAGLAGIPGITFSRLLGKANYFCPEKRPGINLSLVREGYRYIGASFDLTLVKFPRVRGLLMRNGVQAHAEEAFPPFAGVSKHTIKGTV